MGTVFCSAQDSGLGYWVQQMLCQISGPGYGHDKCKLYSFCVSGWFAIQPVEDIEVSSNQVYTILYMYMYAREMGADN